MPKGFDTTFDCSAVAVSIKAAGYEFVARYLSRNSQKAISATEAQALAAAGLSVILVYEDGPTNASYFTPDRGGQDGLRAAQQAHLLTSQDGTTIYFAVDYDASDNDLSAAISPYFQAVGSSLRNFAAQNNPTYRVGVYGSGFICSSLASAGLAGQGWLSQSTGWNGFKTYSNWSIQQSQPITVCGVSGDGDVAIGDYGTNRVVNILF